MHWELEKSVFGVETPTWAPGPHMLSPDMNHGARGRHEVWLPDVVPLFFLHHYATNEFCEILVAGAPPHLRVKIVIPDRKQASANLAVRGNTDPAAVPAKRMGDGRNNANLADAILEAVPSRRLRTPMRDFD